MESSEVEVEMGAGVVFGVRVRVLTSYEWVWDGRSGTHRAQRNKDRVNKQLGEKE